MLRRRDLGHRIVVRRIVGIRGDRPVFADSLGELVELTDTHLTVATARGPVQVPLREVHRAKRVPAPRRATGAQIAALELAAADSWPAPVRERLGDWWLRAAERWTGRANSALPVGDPGMPLDEAIDHAQRWYAARAQPALINVPLPLAAPVNAMLDERGWRTGPPVLVQTAPLAALLNAVPDRGDLPAVDLRAAPTDAWLDLVAARKAGGRPSPLPPAARHVLTAVDQVRFAHAYAGTGRDRPDDGGLLAVARGTVTGQGRWLGLALVEVVPDARRRGLAQQVTAALARWAYDLGATHAFLQVEEHNVAARALYRRLGFTTHHTYAPRSEPLSEPRSGAGRTASAARPAAAWPA
ncbi:MAG TPA: GNAT family N-acetyltransferase [Micromonosporaceae bacterium]